jgi:prolyl oligopeptidase
MAREPSIENYFDLKLIGKKAASYDGSFIAYTVGKTYKKKNELSESFIHLRNLRDGNEEIIKEQGSTISIPQFSLDSGYFSYTSKKEKDSFLSIRNLKSGSSLTIKCPGYVVDYRWDNNNTIIFLISFSDESREKTSDEDGYFFEETGKNNSIFRFDMEHGFREIKNIPHIWEFDSNRGKIVGVASDSYKEGTWFHNYLVLINEDDSFTIKYRPERSQVAIPEFSPDGSKITFIESMWSDRGVTTGDLILLDLTSGKVTNIGKEREISYSCSRWLNNESFIGLVQEEENFSLIEISSKSERRIWTGRGSVGQGMAPEFVMDKENIYLSFSNESTPEEILKIGIRDGKSEILTSLNKDLEDIKKYKWEKIKWRSIDGLEIYGYLRNPGKNMPLLVVVHGGPTASVKETFMDRSSFLLPEGYSIFMPNFRGSTGKGRKYAEMNYGDMGGMDLQDILAGVEYLIKEGLVDKQNISITGGSYGGFMAQWAITQSHLFKSSIALFGISDWVSFHGTTNIPEWDENQYGESAYAHGKFIKFSPIEYADKVNASLLIMHGEVDPCVPINQSYQFYRALKELNKDVRFLIFPREGHGFSEKGHIKQNMEELGKMLKKTIGPREK